MQLSFGCEIEVAEVSRSAVRSALARHNVNYVFVVEDGTRGVDAELNVPPMVMGDEAIEVYGRINDALAECGAQINSQCGLHVHVGNTPITSDATEFNDASLTYSANHIVEWGHRPDMGNGGFISVEGQPMDAALVRDVVYRYARQQDVVNTMLPRSRRNNHFCRPLVNAEHILATRTIDQLQRHIGGKFNAINLLPWSRGTVEFRQAAGTIECSKIIAWVDFILNMFRHSLEERMEEGSRAVEHTTPEQPFRRGSRVGVQYTMMRQPAGATTRDIMDATGCSEQRVRAAVSEIRERIGRAAVITHTQPSQGASYGDGTDLTRYEILSSWTEQGEAMTLRPENRRGVESIFGGLDDEAFEYWQDRIEILSV